MSCEDRKAELNALTDGELGAAAEQSLLDHIAACPTCAAELAGLLGLRARLARIAPMEAPPEALVLQLDRAITKRFKGQFRRQLLLPAGAVFGALALAATLLITLLPHTEAPTIRAVADAGLRQTIASPNIVLANTRSGGADAWFARHDLPTPPTPDLAAAGFRFLGSRADIIAGHRAAVLAYAGPNGQVTLMAWPAHGEPAHKPRISSMGGRAVQYWNDGTLEFWVTGASTTMVEQFTAAYQGKV